MYILTMKMMKTLGLNGYLKASFKQRKSIISSLDSHDHFAKILCIFCYSKCLSSAKLCA